MPDRALTAFACGDTRHDVGALLRGHSREDRVFPAGAFLYDDGRHRVLFDTGYAPEPWRAGAAAAMYRRLLPPRVGERETIDARLRAAGVDPDFVTHVVLSHLHPDHIGGVRFLPNARAVVSAGTARTLARPRIRDGVLRRLLPEGFTPAVVVTQFEEGPHGLRVHDLLGDGSYLLVDLPGHARGHLGALVAGRVLLAGDAAWGRDLLGEEHRIRPLPRAISHDHAALADTARRLLAAEAAGIRLVFSHDRHGNGVELLAAPARSGDP